MAKNYTLKEAANIIAEGKKKDEIMEIGRRFPLLAVSLAAVIAQANEKFLDFINYMPDHITANKINSAMKADVDVEEAEADSDEDETEAPAKAEKSVKKATKKVEAEADSDYSAISGSKLYEMIKSAGKLKDLKAKGFGTKKADLVAYLEQNPLDGADEVEEEAEDEAETAGKYDDMNAMELFKECKKRGIKAAPKKPAKFYVELLEKDDAANADSDEAEAEDEDWDDEEPEEKPVKKSEKKPVKKAEKKATKKSEPVEAEDEDEDDDWDI